MVRLETENARLLAVLHSIYEVVTDTTLGWPNWAAGDVAEIIEMENLTPW